MASPLDGFPAFERPAADIPPTSGQDQKVDQETLYYPDTDRDKLPARCAGADIDSAVAGAPLTLPGSVAGGDAALHEEVFVAAADSTDTPPADGQPLLKEPSPEEPIAQMPLTPPAKQAPEAHPPKSAAVSPEAPQGNEDSTPQDRPQPEQPAASPRPEVREARPIRVDPDQIILHGAFRGMETRRVAKWLDVDHPEQFDDELPKTPEQKEAIQRIGEALCTIGADLGVDLEPRVPSEDAVHFFASREQVVAAAAEENGLPQAATNVKGIFLTEEPDFSTEVVLAHELAHKVSMLNVLPWNLGRAAYVLHGIMERDHPACAVNEPLTNIVALYALDMAGYDSTDIHYTYVDMGLLFLASVHAAADRLGEDPLEVHSALFRDDLVPRHRRQGMNMLKQGLGQRRFTQLLNVRQGSTPDDIKQVMRSMNVSEFAEQYTQRDSDNQVTWYWPWV
jgi:hypothetical protein